MVVTELNLEKFCLDCDKHYIDKISRCNGCDRKLFQQDFPNWTSGNKFIDESVQKTQLNAQFSSKVLEWIPYNKLKNIEYFVKGRFTTIYKAIWSDGPIKEWSNIKRKWTRENEIKVAIKHISSLSSLNEEILNKVRY